MTPHLKAARAAAVIRTEEDRAPGSGPADRRESGSGGAGGEPSRSPAAPARPAGSTGPARDPDPDTALLDACMAIGRAQGIAFRSPGRVGGGTARPLTLERICDASRVRRRRVALHGEWWRGDHGPLLAFRKGAGAEEGAPVAVLPERGGYVLEDPAARSRLPVDTDVAAGLADAAYVFYPPLPRRALRALDLVRVAYGAIRRELVTMVIVGSAAGLLSLLVPVVTARIVGDAIPDGDRPGLFFMMAALLVGALTAALFQVVRSIAVLRIESKMDLLLQAAIWDHLLSLPVSFFRRFSVGDLQARSVGIHAIRELLSGNVVTSLLSLLFSVFSVAILFHYSGRLAVVAMFLLALLAGTTVLLARLRIRRERVLQQDQGRMSGLLFDLLGGIVKLRVAGAERRAFERWAGMYEEQRRHTVEAQRFAGFQAVVTAMYLALAPLVLFAVVGLSAGAGLSVGEFLAFNAAFGQLQAAVFAALSVVGQVFTLVPVYERMRPILQAAPEVDDARAELTEIEGRIELCDVTFRYEDAGPPVLRGVSIRVDPGEFVALVGPSGSGKSTCLRLLLGFEQPAAGTVRVDGHDLATLDPQSVRRQTGVVLQDGQPLVGTIFSNVVGGRNVGLEEAWRAARMVDLESEIRALPMGMYTFINDKGTNFSGGQRQRLLIARAIVGRPRVILLDEATSALDNRTQDTVIRSLESLKATRLVIAHRLSTIIHADRIYVLDGGVIVEEGTYAELVRRGGVFSRMVERQTV
ncbi:MAG: NHLP bacteriocin export ABC transporter permease/ATPase subunit [Longimicrobiaceae bacterium]